MSEHGPILCATDLEAAGARAVELAARLANATGRPLRLVHIAGAGPDLDAEPPATEAERVLRERLRVRVEAAATSLEKERVRAESFGPHVEAELLEGRPWEQILEAGIRMDASVLVVGPHGSAGPTSSRRGTIEEWILGSTADRVVRHATCPVLVASRDNTPTTPLTEATWVVAIDLSDASRAALEAARPLARSCRAKLIGLYVAEGPPRMVGEKERAAADPLRITEAASDDRYYSARAELALFTDGMNEVETVIAIGDPTVVVSQAAAHFDAALLVMGTTGRTGLARLLLGSTTERTLRRSPVPVLTVPAPA